MTTLTHHTQEGVGPPPASPLSPSYAAYLTPHETAYDLLARCAFTPPLPTGNAPFFRDATHRLHPGTVLEVNGTPATGKTILLLHLAASTLLDPNAPTRHVFYLDTDGRFDLLRLCHLLRAQIKALRGSVGSGGPRARPEGNLTTTTSNMTVTASTSNTADGDSRTTSSFLDPHRDVGDIIPEVLERFHLARCASSLDLLATMTTIRPQLISPTTAPPPPRQLPPSVSSSSKPPPTAPTSTPPRPTPPPLLLLDDLSRLLVLDQLNRGSGGGIGAGPPTFGVSFLPPPPPPPPPSSSSARGPVVSDSYRRSPCPGGATGTAGPTGPGHGGADHHGTGRRVTVGDASRGGARVPTPIPHGAMAHPRGAGSAYMGSTGSTEAADGSRGGALAAAPLSGGGASRER